MPPADLSYRAGYYGAKEFGKFNRADKERQLEEALRLEDPITDIPMAIEVNYFQVNQRRVLRADFGAHARQRADAARARAAATTAEIDMIGEIKDEYGVTIRNMRDKLEFKLDAATATQWPRGPIQYETGFTLLPGNYVIKVLARDATTGRIGTFLSSFVVPNLERETGAAADQHRRALESAQPPADALYTVQQKMPPTRAIRWCTTGVKLIPSVTRTFSAGRPLFVFLQAYERDAATMRPLVAFVAFYDGAAKIFEAEPLDINDGWDPKSKAVPIRFAVALAQAAARRLRLPGDGARPRRGKAAFWRAPIVVKR